MAKSTKKKQDPTTVEVSAQTLKDLEEQIRACNLSEEHKKLLLTIVATFVRLRMLLERKKSGLASLLRRMFGIKTERLSSHPRRGKAKKGGKGKGGRGKNGKEDYPGAETVKCRHGTLKPGDTCPDCNDGYLEEGDPGVHYHWSGGPPLRLVIYELERLICDNRGCRAVYKASLPTEIQGEPSVDSATKPAEPDGAKVPTQDPSISPERSLTHGSEKTYDASADAMVACLRYHYGLPHYRLGLVQQAGGVPLPASTQWSMVLRVFNVGMVVVRVLWHKAANGGLLMYDDTRMKILELEKLGFRPPRGPPVKNKDGTDRKKTQTSAIVSKVGEQTIALYATGLHHAGENLSALLRHRDEGLDPPVQMSDGSTQNIPTTGVETIAANCLDHARRKYFDLMSSFESQVKHVLELMKVVYRNDKKAKKLKLNDEERLAFHKKHSTAAWQELHDWMVKSYGTTVEPNSLLGGVINYMLPRWEQLSRFLHVAGAPLSNAECERIIKRAIPHRKGSLFYRTLRGALVGDVMMTLIVTCLYAKTSPHSYLTALCRNADAVRKDPNQWLPWNFHLNLTLQT